jgi:class 3 adenylate cyclase/tetratricopeptide (TPR) repeat protein
MPVCPRCGEDNPARARFCLNCAAPLAAASQAREQRKVVTVLVCDVTGSTELGERLDPEALRAVLARYFERMRAAVEQHGGTVEKFIGDAVMAVFGVPVVHEDDALRAVRAAVEMRDAFPELGVQGRIGITTGEVVTGTEERLATGDAVNVAARLEQSAQPGEILIGLETVALVRDAVSVEAVEPLALKGKQAPVEAYRLLSVGPAAPGRRHAGAMVGRGRELERLRAALAQATADGSCQLFTVLGAAGVGKSRVVHEFLGSLDGGGTVVRGGCLPYGEGITYWPVVEVVKQLLGRDPGPRLAELGLDGSASRAIQAVLGDASMVSSVEEIAWAMRRLLEAVAATSALVVVFDDIHWGEEVFLDLVDHVADLSRDAPILLLCMARPELLDRRPNWGGGKLNATTVLLEPLAAGDAESLVASLLDGEAVDESLRARILDAAEGNPLFAEEMVALVRESPGDVVAVPPTIQALLAARLDQLDQSERNVLERGSVEGRTFHRGAVQAFSPTDEPLLTPLTALVRRELLRPDRPQFQGEDAFRFRHLLIRDAAYDALPKASRAELHERFAAWVGEHVELVELDEVVGYHLEQAHRYRVELGTSDDRLAFRAADRLASAGDRAAARGDVRAATNLLARAAALFRTDEPRRIGLLVTLGRASYETGEWDRADELFSEAIELGRATGDRRIVAHATLGRTVVNTFRGSFESHDRIRDELAWPIAVFEEFGDESGLVRAVGLGGQLRFWKGQAAAALEELERAAVHARNAGDRLQEVQCLQYVLLSSMNGPMPASEALARAARLRETTTVDRRLEVSILRCTACLCAMQGDFDLARDQITMSVTLAKELGLAVVAASAEMEAGHIEVLAGRLDAAEPSLRSAFDRLEAMGDRGFLVTVAPMLADALLRLDRMDEAASLIELTVRWAIEDDLDPQIGWRRVQGRLLARRGDFENAVGVAREAVELAAGTDFIDDHGRALEDLGEVLRLAGHDEDSKAALEHALELYEQKGNTVSSKRVRSLL